MISVICLALPATTSGVGAQDGPGRLPIDRWLLSRPLDAGEAIGALSGDPLAVAVDSVAFPDRDVEVGPTYWTLARRDGQPRFDLSDWEAAPGDGATWAHVFIRAPEDRSLRLAVEPPTCGTLAGWLNGQALGALTPWSAGSPAAGAAGRAPGSADRAPTPPDTVGIRIGAGWNSLLVALTAGDCAPAFAMTLLQGDDTAADERRESTANLLDSVKVQASRPPGVYRDHPASWAMVTGVDGGGDLTWPSASEDLRGTLRYQVTAWGRDPSAPILSADPDESVRPESPPEIDLTGEWQIQTFTPIGRAVLQAELEMSEDGTLEGELRGRRMGGEVSDGWVSGSEFRFVTRLDLGRGRLDVTYRGFANEGSMDGEVSFGQFGEFTSGFEGRRVSGEGVAGEIETEDPEAPADRPARPGDALPGGPDDPPEGGGEGADRDFAAQARRAQIRRQLLPPREPGPPAPASVTVELRAAGERAQGTVEGLIPGRPITGTSSLPFESVRESALAGETVRFTIEWPDGERRIERSPSADGVLRRLHEPITLTGWSDLPGGGQSGMWKVPDALGGLSLALRREDAPGAYSLAGQPLAESGGELVLCSPCRRGASLDLSVTPDGEWSGFPSVVILDAGYPGASGNPAAPPAETWLEQLGERDNQRYKELGESFGGSGSGN